MENRIILLFLLCVGLVVVTCSKSEKHECEIKIDYVGWSDIREIFDNVTGVIHEFDTVQVKSASIEGSEYLTAKLDGKKLIVSVTDAFASYEENETDRSIKATLKYTCNSGKELKQKFEQAITFTNNHALTFGKPEYNFIHYGDLPEGFELTNLIQIEIKDIDISDSLSVTIENGKNFRSYITPTSDPKTSEIKLSTNVHIKSPQETTMTLIVKDGSPYNPPNNEVRATFTLKLIAPIVEELLKFEKPSYYFTATDGDKLIADEAIAIVNGFDSKIELGIAETEYSEYFSVEADPTTGTIKLKLEEELPKIDDKTLTNSRNTGEIKLQLIARYDTQVAETEIIIIVNNIAKICYVPGVDLDYDKKIRNGDDIEDGFVGVIYSISNIRNVKGITCSEKKYLDCVFNIDSGELTISTTDYFKKYEETISKDSLVTNITFECPYEDIPLQFVQRIKDVNSHPPLFSEKEYNFVFYESLSREFELTSVKDVIVSDIDLSHSAYYFHIPEEVEEGESWFGVRDYCHVQNKTCHAYLFPKEDIPVPFNISFELKVEDDKSPRKSSTAKVNVKILDNEQIQQGFTREKYSMYFNNETRLLEPYLDSELPKFVGGMDSEINFEIMSGDYANAFQVEASKLTGNIEVSPFGDQVIECGGCEFISLILLATWRTHNYVTTLIINMHTFNQDFQPTEHTQSEMSGAAHYGFSTFILTSTIGIIAIFVTVALTIFTMLYFSRKIFFAKCNRIQEEPTLEEPEICVKTEKSLY